MAARLGSLFHDIPSLEDGFSGLVLLIGWNVVILAEDSKLVESSDKRLDLPKQESDLRLGNYDIWMVVGPHHLMKSLSELHVNLTQKPIG